MYDIDGITYKRTQHAALLLSMLFHTHARLLLVCTSLLFINPSIFPLELKRKAVLFAYWVNSLKQSLKNKEIKTILQTAGALRQCDSLSSPAWEIQNYPGTVCHMSREAPLKDECSQSESKRDPVGCRQNSVPCRETKQNRKVFTFYSSYIVRD